MNTMIAFRRMRTPKTPITNSTAEKKSASASIAFTSLLAEYDRTDDCREQEHARHLECQQVLVEQRTGDWRDGSRLLDLLRGEALRQRQIERGFRASEREHLRQQRKPD